MKIPRVTLEQWRVLQSVIDCGGFAQAAEALHKSQSSVSYTVSKLQEQLGYPLLVIEGRKAQLTERGEILLRHSRHLVKEAVALEAMAQTLGQDWESDLLLVVDQIFPMPILLRALKAFNKEGQGTQVVLKEVVLRDGVNPSSEGEPDILLSSMPQQENASMEPIIEIAMVAVASPDHVLCRESNLVSRSRLNCELQLTVRGFSIKSGDEAEGADTEKNWTVSSVQSAVEVLENGVGYAWLPKADITVELKSGKLQAINLTSGGEYNINLHAVLSSEGSIGPAAKHLLDLLQTECQQGFLS